MGRSVYSLSFLAISMFHVTSSRPPFSVSTELRLSGLVYAEIINQAYDKGYSPINYNKPWRSLIIKE